MENEAKTHREIVMEAISEMTTNQPRPAGLVDAIEKTHNLCNQAPQDENGIAVSPWSAYQTAHRHRGRLLEIVRHLLKPANQNATPETTCVLLRIKLQKMQQRMDALIEENAEVKAEWMKALRKIKRLDGDTLVAENRELKTALAGRCPGCGESLESSCYGLALHCLGCGWDRTELWKTEKKEIDDDA